jgi:beta-glucuronidase
MEGNEFPLSLMIQDLDLMADMGANAVRTSHYPNDERFLDLCDERGIYVWEENHARGLSLEQMRNPNFIRQCADVNREMVEQHRNHPSIIIWGILNECASDTEEGGSITPGSSRKSAAWTGAGRSRSPPTIGNGKNASIWRISYR